MTPKSMAQSISKQAANLASASNKLNSALLDFFEAAITDFHEKEDTVNQYTNDAQKWKKSSPEQKLDIIKQYTNMDYRLETAFKSAELKTKY